MLGVPERTRLRRGRVEEQIGAAIREGGFDMVVVGAPLASAGERVSLEGVVGTLLNEFKELPFLIVRADLRALDREAGSA
jgi:hypothetical protein